jgi:hypothetical protein
MVVIEIKKANSVWIREIKEIIKKGIGQKIVSSQSNNENWSVYGIDGLYKHHHIGIILWDTLDPKNLAFDTPKRTLEIISFYPFFTEMVKKLESEFEEFDFKIIIEERF